MSSGGFVGFDSEVLNRKERRSYSFTILSIKHIVFCSCVFRQYASEACSISGFIKNKVSEEIFLD